MAGIQERYFNRETSLLDFQERVLAIGENPNVPLLERVKFVAIVSANLDEFFQVRVAALQDQLAAGVGASSPDGHTPSEQLEAIRPQVVDLAGRMERLFHNELVPALSDNGIRLSDWDDLDPDDRKELVDVYEQQIYPVLTPLAVDPSHPFPYISNLSLNLAVRVRDPRTGNVRFARVKVPPLLPRFLVLSDSERFVPVEQVIAAHLDSLFSGMEVLSHHPFRVTRSAEQAVEEEEADDLLEAMESLLLTRHRFSRVVRLEVDSTMEPQVLDLLATEMGLGPASVYQAESPLALAGLWTIYGLPLPSLKDEPWIPVTQPSLVAKGDEKVDVFERIRDGDLLVHLPYDSFGSSVQSFIAGAANDPDVVAIKQTLYRTSDPDDPAAGGETSIIQSLIGAAHRGKQVAVLVELKARFDEEANINWARMLEESGAHVVYGVTGLKTHAKIALVVRREGDTLRRYSHVGTGNYNPKTARIYEDLGLLTADDDIGADLTELFNALTGFSRQRKYRRILVAPVALRQEVVQRIRAQAKRKTDGRVVMKLNHLVDPDVIDELYRASRKGCRIELIVRGICCLRPGVEDLSENITVRSIVGKYLEHSRILRFGEGAEAEYLIGSADLMQRNLNGRVEVIVPITDEVLRSRLEEVLRVGLADDVLAWELAGDGTWSKVPIAEGLNTHNQFEAIGLARSAGAAPDPEGVTEPAGVVMAAGGLVNRLGEDGIEVLLVHRPELDDWSLPKGKVGKTELEVDAALREVLEETGLTCAVGDEVGSIEYYDHKGRRKVVRYWAMTPISGTFTPNEEVDEVRWLPAPDAARTLSYARDQALVRAYADGALSP